jgi:hypothetical protein
LLDEAWFYFRRRLWLCLRFGRSMEGFDNTLGFKGCAAFLAFF